MDDKEKFAYMGGLIDGEGCITLGRKPEKLSNRGMFTPKLIISSTTKELTDWLQAEFGGSIHIFKYSQTRINSSDLYWWYITTRKALEIIQKCYPYLKVKRVHAELFSSYYATVQDSNKPLTPELIKKRLEIYGKLKEANRRGKNSQIAP